MLDLGFLLRRLAGGLGRLGRLLDLTAPRHDIK